MCNLGEETERKEGSERRDEEVSWRTQEEEFLDEHEFRNYVPDENSLGFDS